MSQNCNDIIEPRETDEERAARERRLRAAEIAREFAAIDRERVRPLAAIVSGSATDDDRNRLAGLEARATALRKELAGLGV